MEHEELLKSRQHQKNDGTDKQVHLHIQVWTITYSNTSGERPFSHYLYTYGITIIFNQNF